MVTCLRGHQRLLTRHQPTAGRLGRTVLSSSGAFNTPQLLMLSGIGPRALLEPIGIPVRSNCREPTRTYGTAMRSALKQALITFLKRF